MSAEAAAPERRRRLTVSEILELVLTRGTPKRSGVTLTRNASGETQIEVTVTTGGDGEAATLEAAEAQAQAVYDRLSLVYPQKPAHDGASVTLTRNAKGETQVSIDCKSGAREGCATVAELAVTTAEAYDTLRGRYPMADGTTGKAGSVS